MSALVGFSFLSNKEFRVKSTTIKPVFFVAHIIRIFLLSRFLERKKANRVRKNS